VLPLLLLLLLAGDLLTLLPELLLLAGRAFAVDCDRLFVLTLLLPAVLLLCGLLYVVVLRVIVLLRGVVVTLRFVTVFPELDRTLLPSPFRTLLRAMVLLRSRDAPFTVLRSDPPDLLASLRVTVLLPCAELL